jgi:hypothetical protein
MGEVRLMGEVRMTERFAAPKAGGAATRRKPAPTVQACRKSQTEVE